MRRCLFLPLALAAWVAHAATFEGVVTHVSDGDTLRLRPLHGGATLTIRLEGIDAPELCQPHGPQAREALERQVLRRRVHVSGERYDDHGRLLGRVQLRGVDVGDQLVRQGHAWSYRFRNDRGPYAAEERAARQARRGLWSERDPVEPRVFRRTHGPCT